MANTPSNFLRQEDRLISTLGVNAVTRKFNPYKGKWTLTRLVKREIEHNGGEMPVEDLLTRMSQRGYLKEPLRRSLRLLDVEVIDGMARIFG